MISIFDSIILGAVQGLTEFIPVSSSGHLIVLPRIFHFGEQPLAFDTTLHLGTALALIIFFYKDLFAIMKGVFLDLRLQVQHSLPYIKIRKVPTLITYSDISILGFKLLVACIPAGIVGLLFNDFFENTFRGFGFVAIFLTLGSLLMYLAEHFFGDNSKHSIKSISDIPLVKAVLVGLFQILALFPGVSRSGSTISGGLILGLSREDAAKFSFLVSLPVVCMAGFYKLISDFAQLKLMSFGVVFGGVFSSFIFGLLAIKFLMMFLKSNKLYGFIIYRVLLVILLIILM